jgi:hypothetical protein
MREFQARVLPRLMLESANCLQLAYSDLNHDLRTETRHNIAFLLQMDATDIESAVAALRSVAQQMRTIEVTLNEAGRTFAMRKVRAVRQRVEHATVI